MINWICQPFDKLTPHILYDILRLRSEIFVVEQNCVFLDADSKDQLCWHLMGWQDETLVAYTRLAPPAVIYNEASIGRVVAAITARGNGIGRQLMQRSISECRKLFGNTAIRIGAQLYLKEFYASLGFVPTGGIYPEDGIDHIQMLLL
jgi:ElaA protein